MLDTIAKSVPHEIHVEKDHGELGQYSLFIYLFITIHTNQGLKEELTPAMLFLVSNTSTDEEENLWNV